MAMSVTITMLFISITFFALLPSFAVSYQTYSNFRKIKLPTGDSGATSIAFPDSGTSLKFGKDPYIAVADGRILRWEDSIIGWVFSILGYKYSSGDFVEFAHASPDRKNQECDGTDNVDLEATCGRPMSISFGGETLYIADAYYGLSQVGPLGGLATSDVTNADGVPFKLVAGVDVDAETGIVYFSDASDDFTLGDVLNGHDTSKTGKFIKYDPKTGEVKDLVVGLDGGGSPAVSFDGSYVLFPEYEGGKVNKYWISGPKATTVDELLTVDGHANDITRGETAGEYWFAVELIKKTQASDGSTIVTYVPEGWRIDGNGNVLQKVPLANQFFNVTVDIVQEHGGTLYVGSISTDFIGVYTH